MIQGAPSAGTVSTNERHSRGVIEAEYVRRRLHPDPRDPEYLPTSDLRTAVGWLATADALAILDYGADLSPYRSLFPNSVYKRADIAASPSPDYLLRADGTVPEHDESFDLILSTQVAEHVETPALHFAECHRLLKPGGTLFLSTHGSYEDHGFPNDYQRWTAAGLERDLQRTGFESPVVWKLTVGPRAVVFQIERCLATTYMSRATLAGFFHWLARPVYRAVRPLVNRLCDRWYSSYRIVPSSVPYQNTYLVLVVIARRSASVASTAPSVASPAPGPGQEYGA